MSKKENKARSAKPEATKADPSIIADEILSANQLAGAPRLIFWSGACFQWSRGRYVELDNAELRAVVVRHLNARWSMVRSAHVGNVIEHMRAKTILDSNMAPPAWIRNKPDGFNPNECLATANNILHLPSLAANNKSYSIPATPNFFVLNASDFNIDLKSPPPTRWLAFLKEIWPDDQQSVDTLQEIFGYLLTADTRQQKIFFMVGPKRSGKGTICRVLRRLIGEDNVAGPTLAGLASQFGLATLVGRSLAIISDARLSGRTDQAVVVERLLTISGKDKVTIDRKCISAIHCQLPTRFLILSNELPRLVDASRTIVSRFMVLRTINSFFGREDTALEKKLLAELPGILLWAINGWLRLNKRGQFVQPDAGKELLNDMADLASPVASFVRDCCVLESGALIPRGMLYKGFQAWCATEGIRRIPQITVFGKDLSSAYPEIITTRPTKGNRERCYVGITLAVNDEVPF